MTMVAADRADALTGIDAPRVAPPEPAKHRTREYERVARKLGIKLLPWQLKASNYMNATGTDGWLYRDVCIVVSRQNGKTELLVPRIVDDLRRGKRILHTAHRMRLAHKVFLRVAHTLKDEAKITYANGNEQIVMRKGGGTYTIVAAQRGARGESADTLLVDEVREFEDDDIVGAALPTLTASPDPQVIYLSNAGSDKSVVLNDLKRRGEDGGEGRFAYLEWSAAPDLAVWDRAGWAQANPSLGHLPGMAAFLEEEYRKADKSGNWSPFKTEHLCQWVVTDLPHVVSPAAWMDCQSPVDDPRRPTLAFSMNASSTRATAVMAWQMTDGRTAVVELLDAEGSPLDVDAFGRQVRSLALEHSCKRIAYASWTDASIARHLRRAKPMDGKEFATACRTFASLVDSRRLAWEGAKHISEQLGWVQRKPHEAGTWTAEPVNQDQPVTAVLAAIRAVYLASAPPRTPRIG